ncbi:S8 family serine peptidase [Pilimelia anulata]|nr:S8 family serine peptidase [Pilimelia anulata]
MPAAAAPTTTQRGAPGTWHLAALRTEAAHRLTRGAGVTVAVVDSGVDRHPDLAANLLPGADLTGAGDAAADAEGHGTGMAGVIAGPGGVAPLARLLPLRTSAPGRPGDERPVARAIGYAVDRGARIVNVSRSVGPSRDLARAAAAAAARGVLVVAAAGNRPADVVVVAPARYPGVLAVGATGPAAARAPLSVAGPELALTAPGVDVRTTAPGGRYQRLSGTSVAAAVVAGAAALVWARYPQLTADGVAARLTGTAVDRGPPGRDPEYGHGALDLLRALTAPPDPNGPPAGPAAATAPPTATAGPDPATGPGPTAGPGAAARAAAWPLAPDRWALGWWAVPIVTVAAGALALLARRCRAAPADHGPDCCPAAGGAGPDDADR